MKPIIFLRVAWMKNYKGVTEDDIPYGGGSYIEENKEGGEVGNFLSFRGKYYGFARIKKAHSLRIERLGAKPTDESITNVTVVFFAKRPGYNQQYVVGWYENATLYRSVQKIKRGRSVPPWYIASSSKGVLLPISLRKFDIPNDGPGRTNAWYVMEYKHSINFLNNFSRFKHSPVSYRAKKIRAAKNRGWQIDAEKRRKVEVAAMDATAIHFEAMGFSVEYVHLNKLGWDLEVTKNNIHLKLEVKGTSAHLQTVELTANEFRHSKEHTNYRVCILEHALNTKMAQLHVCTQHKNKKYWISELGPQLKVKEITSAQLMKEEIKDEQLEKI